MIQGRLKNLLDPSSLPRLILLTAILAGFFLIDSPLSPEESRLYQKVRQAQNALWREMERRGEADPANDTDRTGFIGLEWSVTTTTLGSLAAKQNSADPLWAVQCLRWFDRAGLKRGDPIAISASSSFPALLYSALCAAEERGLDTALMVSLGSSTWGANRPEAPWPVLAQILGSLSFLETRPLFYTLGGEGENGEGMIAEGLLALEKAAAGDGVELFRSGDLEAIIRRKMEIIAPEGGKPARLVISLGGSLSSLGRDEAVLQLQNGLIFPGEAENAGNGIIALSLEKGIPVLHLLGLESLAEKTGIDFAVRRGHFTQRPWWPAALGLLAFIAALISHRRWMLEEKR